MSGLDDNFTHLQKEPAKKTKYTNKEFAFIFRVQHVSGCHVVLHKLILGVRPV